MNTKNTKNQFSSTRVAWQVFITAKQFIREPKKWVTVLRRLVVQGFTQAVPRKNLETPNQDESPGDNA